MGLSASAGKIFALTARISFIYNYFGYMMSLIVFRRNFMKKKIFVLLAAFVALTMAGCAAESDGTPPEDGTEVLPGDEATPEGGGDAPEDEGALPEAPPQPEYREYVRLTADGVNIRKGAGTAYAAVGAAEKDTRYEYLGETGGWYRISYKNSVAYISGKYAKVVKMQASENEVVESVIEEGLKLLGVEYVYGAVRYHDGRGNKLKNFTTSAFDCSSLMQYMFYMGADGLLLDVTTRTQVVQGKTVPRSELRRGDLMFFTNAQRYNKTGTERIGHVALYLGENLILHTASDYAKIEEISATRWSYYVQAQRMI